MQQIVGSLGSLEEEFWSGLLGNREPLKVLERYRDEATICCFGGEDRWESAGPGILALPGLLIDNPQSVKLTCTWNCLPSQPWGV